MSFQVEIHAGPQSFEAPPPLRRLRVFDVISDHPLLLAPFTTAQEALLLARRLDVHYLTVVSDLGAPLGVVCRCDLKTSAPGLEVEVCMRSPALTIQSSATLEEAGRAFRNLGVGCLPVVDGVTAMGMLTRRDLVRLGVLDEAAAPRCTACGALEHVCWAPDLARMLCRNCTHGDPDDDDHALRAFELGGSD